MDLASFVGGSGRSVRGSRLGAALASAFAGALALLAPASARAHFFWLTCERDDGGRPVVEAFLSETPVPDGPEFLGPIAGARISARGRALGWARGEDAYIVDIKAAVPEMIDGFCDLGRMKRRGQTFHLIYTARLQFGPTSPVDAASPEADHLRLRWAARPGQGGPPRLEAVFQGKPAAGAEIRLFPNQGPARTYRADEQGRLELAPEAGGALHVLAKWTEKSIALHEGAPKEEVHYYATLAVAPAAARTPAPSRPVSSGPSRVAGSIEFARLPEAATSLGVAVLGDWLYVYGGHAGKRHHYNSQTVVHHFRRLNLRDRTTWEELPPGPALQGTTLAACGGAIYRIGGMAPHNAPDRPHDLVSVASFARYDPASRSWAEMPALPAARSTHDSAVLGDKIYVIGGWSMKGGGPEDTEFLDNALVFDAKRPKDGWKPLPAPPFQRRALAVAAHEGKIYALAGLNDEGEVVSEVNVYDPERGEWSRGPDVPVTGREAFAPSAFEIDGVLDFCGADGQVYRLDGSGRNWRIAGKLATKRWAHRLVPGPDHALLVVGGSLGTDPTDLIELLPLAGLTAPAHR